MTFNNVGLSKDGFEFNGVNSDIIYGSDNSVSDFNEITIEAIFDTDQTATPYGIVSKYVATNGQRSYILDTYDNIIRFILSDDGIASSLTITSASNYSGVVHIICTWDGVTTCMYINGVLVNTGSHSGKLHVNDAVDLKVGHNIHGVSNLDKPVKYVSIYNRGYTAQECLDRYNEVTFNVE
jgi:hypothetical protein